MLYLRLFQNCLLRQLGASRAEDSLVSLDEDELALARVKVGRVKDDVLVKDVAVGRVYDRPVLVHLVDRPLGQLVVEAEPRHVVVVANLKANVVHEDDQEG